LNRLLVYFLPVFAYLLGAVPWGLVLTRLYGRSDIRRMGSGNIGATNVRRAAGNRLALATLIGDILKGAIPVWIAASAPTVAAVWADPYAALVGLMAFLGHLYPVYIGFKTGGKGVATAAGCFLVLAPPAAIGVCLIFTLVVWVTNRVSAGSLAAAAALPVAVWIDTHSPAITGSALIVAGMIYLRHKENLKRLLSGNEPVFRTKGR
jgi:acyl phosphate:glycerol-3-phosphate acyltransferase